MYECNLCHHRATHPAFLRCQRCFQARQEIRGQSRSFTPSSSPQDDYTASYLAAMSYGLASSSPNSNSGFSGGGGSFDGGGASSSYGSGSSGSSSSCSSSDSSSSSSSDSGSSSCSTD